MIDKIGAEFEELESAVFGKYEEVNRASEHLIESAQEFTRAVELSLRFQENDSFQMPNM